MSARPHPRSWHALRAFAVVVGLGSAAWVSGQATDLIISEYVEGSGNEKYIEVYNGTAAGINLADYQIRLYANGVGGPVATPAWASFTTSSPLAGVLGAGATIVYRNASAGLYPAATTLTACNWNGDDAVVLWKISAGAPLDIFGQVGCDPGTAWTAAGISTLDRTVRRKANICTGVTTNPAGACAVGSFTTLLSQWDNFGIDVVAGLGAHTMTCGPTVNFGSATGTAVENAGVVTVTLNLSPATTGAGSITVSVANGAGVTYGGGGDYTTTPAVAAGTITIPVGVGATSVTFDINLVDNGVTESSETITFTITGTTGGISLGSALVHTFTITDDDAVPTIDFSTLSITVLETAGAQVFQLNINPAAPSAGSITIQVTDGPGSVYGAANDYTTTPVPVAGSITVNFAAGATNASFTASVMDDALIEGTETVTFTVTGVPAGFAIGSNTAATLTIGDNDTPPTVLDPGDLAIVGVNANNFACGGGSGEDMVSFFCFKPIVPGTVIDLTDNGYEKCNPGLWGDVEGTVRMTRTGVALPAGQVITFRISNVTGAGNVVALAPDAGWTCASLNGATSLNMNVGGDQVFFMQGGTWTNPAGAENATYSGQVLFGFSTNPTFPWSALCGSTQRSNLPPGIDCFSMAPTSATDFAKYIGPITAATQRAWILRLDNTANWTTYPNCADYNSMGYNWLTAGIMPITVAPFVPGLWLGAVTTDWFECKNWDDARVPTITTDVRVSDVATRNCIVGATVPGAAECASMIVTSAGAVRNLIVQNTSTLTIDGPITVERTVTGAPVTALVAAGSSLSATDVIMQSVGVDEGVFQVLGTAAIENDVTLAAGGRLNLNGAPGGTLYIGGDYSNTALDETRFLEGGSNVILNGAAGQTITTSGFEEVFQNLQLAKTGGDVYFDAPVAVRGVLDLLNGRVFTEAPTYDLLTLRSGASVTNASNTSFVHGPVQKIGNTPFIFPVGKGNLMRPCQTTNLAATSTDAFAAEYFPISAYTWGLAMEPTLDHLSACEYWIIERSVGTPNARVSLSWDNVASCGVTVPADLRVARWDASGSIWRDRGNNGETLTAWGGWVPSGAVQTLFSPWTLASVSPDNPLPIELLSFTAKPSGDDVQLDWVTASERNNAYFTVERSRDGIVFAPVLEVPGAGTSAGTLYYTDLDPFPYSGLSYYRLRQTDFDGTSVLSAVVPVMMGDGRPLTVFGTSGTVMAMHGFPSGSSYEVLDLTGRLLRAGTTVQESLTEVAVGDLPRGAYVFRMSDGARVESVRFLY